MIKCNICNKIFKKKKSMTNHRRWHMTKDGRFKNLLNNKLRGGEN